MENKSIVIAVIQKFGEKSVYFGCTQATLRIPAPLGLISQD